MKELEELKSLLLQSRAYLASLTPNPVTNVDSIKTWKRYVQILQEDYDKKLETEVIKYLNNGKA